MDLCFLIDISTCLDDVQGQDAAFIAVGALLSKAVQANYSIRWGYKIIDSRSEPHAFEARYKSVAGHADSEFPSGSPLQKGGQDLEQISSANISTFLAVLRRLTEPAILIALATCSTGGGVGCRGVGRLLCIQKYFALLETYFASPSTSGSDGQGSSRQAVTLLMSSAPKSAMSLLYFLDADGKSLDVARKDMWALMQAVAKPELRKVFAAMHSRPCWLDTGPDLAPQQQPQEPDDWRIGVRANAGADQRYRYGVFIEVDEDSDSYRVRFDDSSKSVLVPIAGHSFDWVQPDSRDMAKQAQKEAAQTGTYKEDSCGVGALDCLNRLMSGMLSPEGSHGQGLYGQRAFSSVEQLSKAWKALTAGCSLDASAAPANVPELDVGQITGLALLESLCVHLEPGAVARTGGVEHTAKDIKKKRALERKNGRKGKARPGSAGQLERGMLASKQVPHKTASLVPDSVGTAQRSPAVETAGPEAGRSGVPYLELPATETLNWAQGEYEACLAHCPSTLAPAAVSDMQRTAALLVGNAMHSLRRCPGADVANILRDADSSGQVLPMYATSARSPEEAHRQGALHITLLQDPLDLTEKYNIEGTETQGHRAARRSEQLLQLFLYLHVLAAEQPGTRAEDCFVEDVCELLSELSISLFGQPVTAQDILTAEIQPHFGTKLPCIVEGLKSTCGGQEGSLSSYDLGPRPSGSVRMARDQQQESECGSIDNTSVIPSSGQARRKRAASHGPSPSGVHESSRNGSYASEGSRGTARHHTTHVTGRSSGSLPQHRRAAAVSQTGPRTRMAPLVNIPGRVKVSIAEMQRKNRKHRKRAAAGTAAGARAHPAQSGASAPLSTTPEDQRTEATRGLLTPQSRRKRTPEDAHHLDSIPETTEKPPRTALADDPSTVRQPNFGGLVGTDKGVLESIAASEDCEDHLHEAPAPKAAKPKTWLDIQQQQRPKRAKKAQQPLAELSLSRSARLVQQAQHAPRTVNFSDDTVEDDHRAESSQQIPSVQDQLQGTVVMQAEVQIRQFCLPKAADRMPHQKVLDQDASGQAGARSHPQVTETTTTAALHAKHVFASNTDLVPCTPVAAAAHVTQPPSQRTRARPSRLDAAADKADTVKDNEAEAKFRGARNEAQDLRPPHGQQEALNGQLEKPGQYRVSAGQSGQLRAQAGQSGQQSHADDEVPQQEVSYDVYDFDATMHTDEQAAHTGRGKQADLPSPCRPAALPREGGTAAGTQAETRLLRSDSAGQNNLSDQALPVQMCSPGVLGPSPTPHKALHWRGQRISAIPQAAPARPADSDCPSGFAIDSATAFMGLGGLVQAVQGDQGQQTHRNQGPDEGAAGVTKFTEPAAVAEKASGGAAREGQTAEDASVITSEKEARSKKRPSAAVVGAPEAERRSQRSRKTPKRSPPPIAQQSRRRASKAGELAKSILETPRQGTTAHEMPSDDFHLQLGGFTHLRSAGQIEKTFSRLKSLPAAAEPASNAAMQPLSQPDAVVPAAVSAEAAVTGLKTPHRSMRNAGANALAQAQEPVAAVAIRSGHVEAASPIDSNTAEQPASQPDAVAPAAVNVEAVVADLKTPCRPMRHATANARGQAQEPVVVAVTSMPVEGQNAPASTPNAVPVRRTRSTAGRDLSEAAETPAAEQSTAGEGPSVPSAQPVPKYVPAHRKSSGRIAHETAAAPESVGAPRKRSARAAGQSPKAAAPGQAPAAAEMLAKRHKHTTGNSIEPAPAQQSLQDATSAPARRSARAAGKSPMTADSEEAPAAAQTPGTHSTRKAAEQQVSAPASQTAALAPTMRTTRAAAKALAEDAVEQAPAVAQTPAKQLH